MCCVADAENGRDHGAQHTQDEKRGHRQAARGSEVSSDAAGCMQRDLVHCRGAVAQRQTAGETGTSQPQHHTNGGGGEHRSSSMD